MEFTLLQPRGGCDAERGAYIGGLVGGLRHAGHGCHLTHGTEWAPAHIPIIDVTGLAAFAPDAMRDAVGLIYYGAEAEQTVELSALRRLVVPSQTVASALRQTCGFGSERITVLQPGVADLPRSTGSGAPACRILAVGALTPRQGYATLICALAALSDLTWQLTIVGDMAADPAHTAFLQTQIATDAPSRVRLVGALEPAALEAEWRRADVFATATERADDAGLVADAIRRGLPVSVTADGAAAERVAPDFAVICPPGDAEQLSKALRRLIFDTALRADMAAAAWQAGQALPDWPAQARRFVTEVT